jgi:hypothetical protein
LQLGARSSTVKILEPSTLKWEHPSVPGLASKDDSPKGPQPKRRPGLGPQPPSTPPPPLSADATKAALAPVSTRQAVMNQYLRFQRMRRAARVEL